jgi:hypothetical protein
MRGAVLRRQGGGQGQEFQGPSPSARGATNLRPLGPRPTPRTHLRKAPADAVRHPPAQTLHVSEEGARRRQPQAARQARFSGSRQPEPGRRYEQTAPQRRPPPSSPPPTFTTLTAPSRPLPPHRSSEEAPSPGRGGRRRRRPARPAPGETVRDLRGGRVMRRPRARSQPPQPMAREEPA